MHGRLTVEGPTFGYFPNPSKTYLVTKKSHFDETSNMFAGSEVNVTLDGRPYLGVAIGSHEYVEECVSSIECEHGHPASISLVKLQSQSLRLPFQP